MYAHSRSGSIGHAPTSVWKIVYSSIGVGRAGRAQRRAQLAPAPHRRRPLVRHPGERADPRAHVARALRVVRLASTAGRAGSARRAAALPAWNVVHVDREAARVAADVAQREQPRVAVERGVLDALGHDRRRRLLEARHELRAAPARATRRSPASRSTRRSSRRGQVADVRAVDRQRGERLLEPLDARPQPPQPVDVGRERRARLLELGLGRPVAERARVAAQLLPQRGQRRLAGGIDEQRRDVVEELVADRALDRPVAQLLAGVEDLLDPHVLGAAVAQPLEVAGRDRRARRGGRSRSPSTSPSRTSASASRCVSANTSGSSWRTPARWSMSKKRRCRPGLGIEVEELRAPLAGRPSTGSRRRPPCGSGTMSSTIPRPAARAAAASARKPCLAAERVREAASGRSRRSRAWSPRAPRTPARGRGARRRGRAGTGRARRRRRTSAPPPSCSR